MAVREQERGRSERRSVMGRITFGAFGVGPLHFWFVDTGFGDRAFGVVDIMCPTKFCGRKHPNSIPMRNAGRRRPQNIHSEFSQSSNDLSSRQTARLASTSEQFDVIGGSQICMATCFIRKLISAYRLVVSTLVCPSHARMTLTSTPDSSRLTAVACRNTCGEICRS